MYKYLYSYNKHSKVLNLLGTTRGMKTKVPLRQHKDPSRWIKQSESCDTGTQARA